MTQQPKLNDEILKEFADAIRTLLESDLYASVIYSELCRMIMSASDGGSTLFNGLTDDNIGDVLVYGVKEEYWAIDGVTEIAHGFSHRLSADSMIALVIEDLDDDPTGVNASRLLPAPS